MTEYGLPLRFKAVDTETGREFIDDLEYDGHFCDTCNSSVYFYQRDADDCSVCGRQKLGEDLEAHYSLFFAGAGREENTKIYQSTGHHDANGKEIFFGNVLLSAGANITWYSAQLVLGDLISLVCIKSSGLRVGNAWVPVGAERCIQHAKGHMIIIGNRHNPHGQLEAAAQKVRSEHAD